MKNVIVGLFVLAAAQPAWAFQNIKVGGVDINPLVSVKQIYDNNIYLLPTPTSANITRSAAGVNLAKQFGSRLDLKAGYLFEKLNYSRSPGNNDAEHHTANLAVDAKLLRNATLTLKNDFAQTTDQATSELTERAKRLQNTAGVSLESPLRGKFGYGVDIQHNFNNYEAAQYNMLDRAEYLAGVNISYKLQPKTKLFLGYTYGNLRYAFKNATTNTRANDSTYDNFDLGITGNLAPKLVGTIKANTQLRHYKEDYTILGVTADNDVTTGGYSAQLQWKPLDKTEVVLFGKRANVESTYSASRFYTSTLNDLTLSREIRKFKVGVGGSFETINYPEVTPTTGNKRVDENTNARVTVDYSIQKWLKVGASYAYKHRNSNENANDYNDNVAGLEIKGMF